MAVHKETFFQMAYDGIPSTWVVQYFESSPFDFPDAAYFGTEEEAREFEKTLEKYDDWLSSQEIPLAIQ